MRLLLEADSRLHLDGHSCGNWAHFFYGRVLAYAADSVQLGSCTFPAYLGAGLRDFKGLEGGVRADAEQHQRRLATQRSDELRELLRELARSGSLPWGKHARLADFVEEGVVEEPTFIERDEDLFGDDEFNPILLT